MFSDDNLFFLFYNSSIRSYEFPEIINSRNIIAKVKDKLIEDPGFNISIKNLETLNISASMIKKHGGIKKISDSCKNFDLNETYESIY
jgi:hypothetical protein